MKRTLLMFTLLAASAAHAAPQVTFDTASIQISQANPAVAQTFPRVAINPVNGSTFALFFSEATDIVLQVRNTATQALISSRVLTNAETGWNGGELAVAFSPDATVVYLGWGVGADGGVEAVRVNPADGTLIGTKVVISAGFGNKPKFDFFGDGSLLIGYEAADGVGNQGGAAIRRYNADLTPAGSEIIVNDPGLAGPQGDTAVAVIRGAALAQDRVLVAWEDTGNGRFGTPAGTEDDVLYRLYEFDSGLNLVPSAAFAPVPANNLIPGGSLQRSKMGNPAVAVANDGSYMIAYEGEAVPSGSERVFGSFFNPAGVAASVDATEISAASLSGRQQAISARYNTTTNAYVVFWNSRGSNTAPIGFFGKDGIEIGTAFNANDTPAVTNLRYGAMDLVGNQGIATWQTASGIANSYYRLFTVSDSSEVNGWMSFE